MLKYEFRIKIIVKFTCVSHEFVETVFVEKFLGEIAQNESYLFDLYQEQLQFASRYLVCHYLSAFFANSENKVQNVSDWLKFIHSDWFTCGRVMKKMNSSNSISPVPFTSKSSKMCTTS